MKRLITPLACCLVFLLQIWLGEVQGSDKKEEMSLEPDEIDIGFNGITMPLGRVLLIRKGVDYCALKFVDFWYGKTEEDQYCTYDLHYQGDGSGDFSKPSVQVKRGKLVLRRMINVLDNPILVGRQIQEIECGPIKLRAYGFKGHGVVLFFGLKQPDGDYGVELAPTKWRDISGVNASDLRLRWYRYDKNRKAFSIPIEQLW